MQHIRFTYIIGQAHSLRIEISKNNFVFFYPLSLQILFKRYSGKIKSLLLQGKFY